MKHKTRSSLSLSTHTHTFQTLAFSPFFRFYNNNSVMMMIPLIIIKFLLLKFN